MKKRTFSCSDVVEQPKRPVLTLDPVAMVFVVSNLLGEILKKLHNCSDYHTFALLTKTTASVAKRYCFLHKAMNVFGVKHYTVEEWKKEEVLIFPNGTTLSRSSHDGLFGCMTSESMWMNGRLHGPDRIFFANGQLNHETCYVNGNQHGLDQEFYRCGQIKHIRSYVDGKAHGLNQWFDGDGDMTFESFYLRGIEIRRPYPSYLYVPRGRTA